MMTRTEKDEKDGAAIKSVFCCVQQKTVHSKIESH